MGKFFLAAARPMIISNSYVILQCYKLKKKKLTGTIQLWVFRNFSPDFSWCCTVMISPNMLISKPSKPPLLPPLPPSPCIVSLFPVLQTSSFAPPPPPSPSKTFSLALKPPPLPSPSPILEKPSYAPKPSTLQTMSV